MKNFYKILNNVLESNNLKTFESFNDTDDLRNDLGLDSFMLAELTVEIEEEFNVDIFESGIVFTIEDIKNKLNE
ncbi:acyl carrier protein [Flavobacteriales bacterium]|nr:acyl carrier protein [Flavobacteriales bacterium]